MKLDFQRLLPENKRPNEGIARGMDEEALDDHIEFEDEDRQD